MNNEEAKFILQGYRPNGADAGDATFRAALEQANTDPVLGAWFAQQQAFDAAVGAKLAEVQPPAGLRAAILTGSRLSEDAVISRPWWKHPAWLAAAAGLVILLAVGVGTLSIGKESALIALAIDDAKLSATHGGHGEETAELQSFFASSDTRLGQRLPHDFDRLRASGCRSVRFAGREVLEVCFKRNGVWFHCYVARAADFPHLTMPPKPQLEDHGSIAVASWADAGHLVVVVSKTGRKNLEALL